MAPCLGNQDPHLQPAYGDSARDVTRSHLLIRQPKLLSAKHQRDARRPVLLLLLLILMRLMLLSLLQLVLLIFMLLLHLHTLLLLLWALHV
jgi:hypothetical protein